jgi:hypothetical protein
LSSQQDIVLIDDRPYGLQQIIEAIPLGRRHLYRVLHYSTFADYRAVHDRRPHVVLLDYFLDLDGVYGAEIVHEIEADVIVAFSSAASGCEAIVAAARERAPQARMPQLYAVRKCKAGQRNDALVELFAKILE